MLAAGDTLTIPVLATPGVRSGSTVRSYTVVIERVVLEIGGDTRYYVRNDGGRTIGILASTVARLQRLLPA